MKKEVLCYDGYTETVNFELVELTQVGENSYLMDYDGQRDEKAYYIVAEHNGIFSNTGMVVFEKDQNLKEHINQCAEKTSPESVAKKVNWAIEKDQEVFSLDLELSRLYELEEYQKALNHMAPKNEKKERTRKQIEEIDRRNKEQKAAEESRKREMEKKHRWIGYKYLMYYIHNIIKKPGQEEKYFELFHEWYESPLDHTKGNASILQKLINGDYEFLYFLIENYISDIELSQGDNYEMHINYQGKQLVYTLPKPAYDYVKWRLQQR